MSINPKVFNVRNKEDEHIAYWFSNHSEYDDLCKELVDEYGEDFCEEYSGFLEIDNS